MDTLQRGLLSNLLIVLDPVNESDEVSGFSQSKDGASVAYGASTVGVREFTDIFFFHYEDVCEGLKSFVHETCPSSFLLKSNPGEDSVHHWGWWWFLGHIIENFNILLVVLNFCVRIMYMW